MKVVRFKRPTGQKIWRIADKNGKFLGRTLVGVWPKLDLRRRRSPGEFRYSQICHALECIATLDDKGFIWLIDGHAEVALQAIKLCVGFKPVPRWAVYAVANGWRIPKDWNPDNCIGDAVMSRERLDLWLERRRKAEELETE